MKIWTRKLKKNGRVNLYFCGILVFSYKMKLGVSYNVFDGQELLESSIKSIRENVDYINVIYQNVSYSGEKADNSLEPLLFNLLSRHLVDEIFLYEAKYEDPHMNEKAKRDKGLSLAKKAGCTHFMSMDVDEYYVSDQLKTAKEKIIKNGIKASAACIIEYLKEPVYQMVNSYSFNMNKDFYTFYVPFIMKINKFFLQKHGSSSFPCLVDPTRGLNCSKKFYLFPAHELAMHHMSSIRKNLDKKYKNSNLMNSSDEVQKYVRNIQQQVLDFDFEKNKKFLETYSMFNQSLIRKVDNVFGIEFDDERINDFQKD